MSLFRRKIVEREDIVAASMSEIMLFFLFVCLILLGNILDLYGATNDAGPSDQDQAIAQLTVANAELTGKLNGANATIAALRGQILRGNADVKDKDAKIGAYAAKNKELEERIAELELQITLLENRHDLPMSISLAENAGYTFDSGETDITPEFRREFSQSGQREFRDLLANAQVAIQAIEVIGHTDERPVNTTRYSNLDRSLKSHVNGFGGSLRFVDNVGLGMARAAEVAQFLKQYLPPGKSYQIIPLSAGQLQLPNNRLAPGRSPNSTDIQARRRIEIRLRSQTR
ncbi:hypothetical protein [Aestuariicoccus sp. MJ-SS9]|uniref:hypothetical protein n=1 Tax=Aestuariicoccus sp. MJ-SS9 TaxID=3079855 RepID=UPI00291329AE|nr:hypothetical protein [Aestuariicoccus sp. MJ-SS9]MDU8910804.1 hypothetical protein [Aestuariicoccus sp. MJ-SS9]